MSNKLVDKRGLTRYHMGVNTPMVSPNLVNTLVNNFRIGASRDTHENYTDDMENGIITLDEIGGATLRDGDMLVNIEIANIYIPKLVSKLTPGNLMHVDYGENHGYSFVDDRLEIASNKGDKFISVTHAFDGLKDGFRYTFSCDLTKTGSPTFTIDGCDNKGNWLDCFEYYSTANNKFIGTFVYSGKGGIGFRVYSATGTASGGGSVTLSNMKIIEHKPNTNSPRVKLRSLPHGVCDFARDNKKIKHVDSINLNGSEKWEIVDISKSNTNMFKVKLPNASFNTYNNAIILNSNRYVCMSYSSILIDDVVGFAISPSGELMFRVGKGINSAQKIKDHLMLSETDLFIEYECITTLESIDLSINYEKGDMLYIDSPLDITSTHCIQMNTKSQSDSNRRVLGQRYLSLIDKIKTLFDGKYRITPNGYICLPTALGGLKLQWFVTDGVIKSGTNSIGINANYPIRCSSWSRVVASVRDAVSNTGAPPQGDDLSAFRCSVNEKDDCATCFIGVRKDTAPSIDVKVSATVFVIGK